MKRITIVGGGLAGLTLGIGLRQCGVPVTVWEAGRYPRHRVCGEFISGRGQATLARLGLREVLERAGAVRAKTAAFFTANTSTGPQPLPAEAICLSRYDMDRLLAQVFRGCDGELLEGRHWPSRVFGEGTVRASGRRLEDGHHRSRWFGLKIHARQVVMSADLEMHILAGGYVGLCRVNGDAVNVCGLFRQPLSAREESTSRPLQGADGAWAALRGQPGSALNDHLAAADFDESSICAVAGLSLQPQRAASRREVCVGDAITMIAPMTGNGMSMAFESAEMAIEPLCAWSRGEASWPEIRQTIAQRCDHAFSQRLTWARGLQALAFSPVLQSALMGLASRCQGVWRSAFERTR